jgi:glycine dehydrogenase
MPDLFAQRHIGPDAQEIQQMLDELGVSSLDALMDEIIPAKIRTDRLLSSLEEKSEAGMLADLKAIAGRNTVQRSLIGMGYYDTVLPPVIQRNILENPGWYTAYTPYQAEISQGRMEALLNFQTMVADLTGMDIANASLLDEATAVAEAVTMAWGIVRKPEGGKILVDSHCHPQTIHVVRTRAHAIGVEVQLADLEQVPEDENWVAVVSQYPDTLGRIRTELPGVQAARDKGALWIVAADLLALTILAPPGQHGADMVVGSCQRFGMPLGFGGPHAAYFATREKYKRQIPGRLIGVSRDAEGRTALRLSLQTREQHIRRDKATSNICTAQVLPAVISATYAVYHGPDGLRNIALEIARLTSQLAQSLAAAGLPVSSHPVFDTVTIQYATASEASDRLQKASKNGYNLRSLGDGRIGISLDEKSDGDEIRELVRLLTDSDTMAPPPSDDDLGYAIRPVDYMSHPVFHSHRSESQLLRYLKELENKDISLTRSMIPLGSCTMKLNATAEMVPVTWQELAAIHPYAPVEQAQGYMELIGQLETWLAELTGFSAVSLQPNAGSQGEYAGLLAIKEYHQQRGESHRDVCLIPESAHGTNFASAVMAGYRVVLVPCDADGNIDIEALQQLADQNSDRLAAIMVTYPSTHGVFEEEIMSVCQLVHDCGGQVYMDGANFNAQVGWTTPRHMGADVCHLNLHKTFCIPHGGGGPGVGPIGVAAHLKDFLPGHPVEFSGDGVGPVSAAPWGSALILTISWAYIAMMGGAGLRQATAVAMLNANYIAHRLDRYFPVLYRGTHGRVAHECILDCRSFREYGIEVEDIAKRLMDFGFHAPTMSWPVPGTLMVEPTESESLEELERFCEAMEAIYHEIITVRDEGMSAEDNPLKQAPHTAETLVSDNWNRSYSREQAAFPLDWVRKNKYWPPVGRVDNVYGDRNLFCSCYLPGSEASAKTAQ